jgi:hypothetical protein
VFGSIAEKVVKLVQCPILLLRCYGMIRRENFNDRQEVKIGRFFLNSIALWFRDAIGFSLCGAGQLDRLDDSSDIGSK